MELIVALDYPRWFSLQRLLRRTLMRAVTREETCNGNVESWSQVLSADSILLWHFRSWARKRGRIRQWASDPATVLEWVGQDSSDRDPPRVLHLRSARSTEAWLRSLDR